MTTIAISIKDGILAADTQLTDNDIKVLCHKITVLPDNRVVACAGPVDEEEWFKAWLIGDLKKLPRLKKLCAILIEDKQAFYFIQGPEKYKIEHPFYAIGNGWKVAMAGMHAGLSAVNSVKLAGELDIYTNTIVDHYVIKTKRLTYGT